MPVDDAFADNSAARFFLDWAIFIPASYCFFVAIPIQVGFSFLKAMTHFLIRDWGCAALPIFVTVVAVYACWIGVVKLASYLGWGGTEIATWKSQSYGAYAAQGAAGTGSAGMGFVSGVPGLVTYAAPSLYWPVAVPRNT